MRSPLVFLSCILVLVSVACDSKDAATGPAASSSAAPKTTSAAPAATPSATAASAASDPTADYPAIQASCDGSKKLGECTEYKELGLLGDSMKSNCEAVGGTYSTSARCPKEGRLSMCAAQTQKKVYYYKPYFELMKPEKTVEFCKDTLMGTYHELAKADAKPAEADKKK
jgi:hypothetical protein